MASKTHMIDTMPNLCRTTIIQSSCIVDNLFAALTSIFFCIVSPLLGLTSVCSYCIIAIPSVSIDTFYFYCVKLRSTAQPVELFLFCKLAEASMLCLPLQVFPSWLGRTPQPHYIYCIKKSAYCQALFL